MRLTENYKFGKTHFSLESVIVFCYLYLKVKSREILLRILAVVNYKLKIQSRSVVRLLREK